MRVQFQQAFRAVVLMAFVAFLVQLHQTGDIVHYINPKYEHLSMIGAWLFLVLFLTQIFRIWSFEKPRHKHAHCNHAGHKHDHGDGPLTLKKVFSYGIIILPLATGLIFPETTLDASIAEKKGIMLSLGNNGPNSQGEEGSEDPVNQGGIPTGDHTAFDPNVLTNTMTSEEYESKIEALKQSQEITMTEQMYAAVYQEINNNPSAFVGKKISFSGFVYREQGFTQSQVVLSRFLITHCIADAGVVGFLSEFEGAGELAQDTWIEATGELTIQEYNGKQMPTIQITDWKTIEQPEQPYVYPVQIQYL
ncbi:TIGR03943 family putative permease subunit [Oceanobacillus kapialis]|uniref:TIGR03943 family putative permease subunit n=1 Tax=Oceanobacillus kapialis TaxID=481353 RepID=A0ABW5PVQ7_9BACI